VATRAEAKTERLERLSGMPLEQFWQVVVANSLTEAIVLDELGLTLQDPDADEDPLALRTSQGRLFWVNLPGRSSIINRERVIPNFQLRDGVEHPQMPQLIQAARKSGLSLLELTALMLAEVPEGRSLLEYWQRASPADIAYVLHAVRQAGRRL
jgi:hypothetical protein